MEESSTSEILIIKIYLMHSIYAEATASLSLGLWVTLCCLDLKLFSFKLNNRINVIPVGGPKKFSSL
jgi:hypothetical protein